jgi:uncharacterized protein YyaL (SSP411 family)
MNSNRLAQETSPYLLQHQDNPVDWQPWGEQAFKIARETGKPILLSIGYAACHWCHVMAHESFEDADIAAVMNDLYVNIKVDREERPDIDTIYQAALQMLGEQGGWPLTMFLNHEREPFWGGTYFPPTPRFGRPGFPQVLQGIAGVYHDDPDRVKNNTEAMRQGLQQLSQAESGGDISVETMNSAADRLVREVDPVHGGVGGAPKFPQPSFFDQLWRAWKRTQKTSFRDAVVTTLNQMCQGGIYDHLRGGFARYSVDDRWLAPHFEKMLYDNAQLVDLLTLVWQDTRDPLYGERVAETVDWILGDMTDPEGGFVSSLDADSEGEEGKFCVWSEAEIDAALGEDAAVVKEVYDVSSGGNWEGTNILNRLGSVRLGAPAREATLTKSRTILLDIRRERIQPGKDDKVLADWNGMMIAALVNAGLPFEQPDWVAAAARAFAFVRETMTEDGRLRHSWRAGKLNHPAILDDYANMSRAALALFEATGEQHYLDAAIDWTDTADKHYLDDAGGGYFLAAKDTPNLIAQSKSVVDNAVPAGNGTLVGVFARLYFLTGDLRHLERARRIVFAFSGELSRNIFPLATLLNSNDLMLHALQIVIVGQRGEAATDALLRAVYDTSLPNRVVTVIAPNEALPESHPAFAKGQLDNIATAYVCEGTICSPPLNDVDGLRANLATR